ncbi:MAG TPA: hypothetical protein VF600_07660 [Abditibacteriaceae bacterium]|jgi:hypothetical protein
MGYDLHITRAENWWENEGKEIGENEWLDLVDSDAEHRLTGFAEATSPQGETIRYENPLLAEWLGHPKLHVVWFDFGRGNVIIKNPDEATLGKMQQLAQKLNAKVQGDEGETYS